ncbi:MAG: methylenetetrahydrofolate reductase C-terminal domain-containing protein [Dehalococcoidia bacterium]
MLISEQKPFEEILTYLDGDKNIFLIGCKGCAEGWGSGGEKQVAEMWKKLQEQGKTIAGSVLVDMLCDSVLTRLKLRTYKKEITAADSILVLTDGAGVQTVAALVNKVVHPGCNTLSSGGAHAEWKEAERCLECGDCMLEFTGGICPIARCSKHLLNGPCGGSQGGKCEVDPDITCVWQEIVDQLTRLGQLNKLERLVTPKNWSVSLISGPPVKRFS